MLRTRVPYALLPESPDQEFESADQDLQSEQTLGASASLPPGSAGRDLAASESEVRVAPGSTTCEVGTRFGRGELGGENMKKMAYPSGAVTPSQAPAPPAYPTPSSSYPAPTRGLGGQHLHEAAQPSDAAAAAAASGQGGLRLRQMNAPPQVERETEGRGERGREGERETENGVRADSRVLLTCQYGKCGLLTPPAIARTSLCTPWPILAWRLR